jgi:hypothetical protein
MSTHRRYIVVSKKITVGLKHRLAKRLMMLSGGRTGAVNRQFNDEVIAQGNKVLIEAFCLYLLHIIGTMRDANIHVFVMCKE